MYIPAHIGEMTLVEVDTGVFDVGPYRREDVRDKERHRRRDRLKLVSHSVGFSRGGCNNE